MLPNYAIADVTLIFMVITVLPIFSNTKSVILNIVVVSLGQKIICVWIVAQ